MSLYIFSSPTLRKNQGTNQRLGAILDIHPLPAQHRGWDQPRKPSAATSQRCHPLPSLYEQFEGCEHPQQCRPRASRPWWRARAAHLRLAKTVYTADTQSAGACTSTK